MDYKQDHHRTVGGSRLSDPVGAQQPGKRTLTEGLVMQSGVQQAATAAPAQDPAQVHAAAARGTATPAGSLPFADRIQALFGPRYDVSAIQAHTGNAASEAATAMGATAYATGNHTVFAGAPDLHNAAHEAAHVVQQQAGVHLAGGVGRAGDAYEQHADAVADLVVQGKSAAPLLDAGPGGSSLGGGPAIQKSDQPEAQQAQQQGPGFIVEAVMEGMLLASGGSMVTLAMMIVQHKLGHDPALWVFIQRKLGDQKAKELHDQVDDPSRQIKPPDATPDAKTPDYKVFCASFPTTFAKCMSGFPEGMTEALVPQYFTADQVAAITTYMSTNVVPANLFHQASGPKLTAQQRILMSGVILANGTLPPELQSAGNLSRDPLKDDKGKASKDGKHDNKLHATMCGHWAQQVYLYAGANMARDNKQSLETVDSGGTLHLGNATPVDKTPFGLHADTTGLPLEGKQKEAKEAQDAREADEKAKAEAEGKEYKPKNHMNFLRHAEMGPEVFDTLQPGDWIYIYNANADASGEHSEIFIGWADKEVQTDKTTDIKYRTANVMSQMNVGDGGKTHQQKIGTAYAPGIAPVTSIQRVKENSGELLDVNTLVASDAVTKNTKTIADKKIDATKLYDYLVGKASSELAALVAKKLDAKQQAMFQKAIDGATTSSPEALALLVACVQRLDLASGNLFAARTANGIIDSIVLKDIAMFKES